MEKVNLSSYGVAWEVLTMIVYRAATQVGWVKSRVNPKQIQPNQMLS